MTQEIEEVLTFWFGELDEFGMSPADRRALWFKPSEDTDTFCRLRFGELVEQALAGGLQDWEQSDHGTIALVLLLDQFTRNIFRGTARAFAGDPRARAISRHCIAHGHHQRMPAIHQVFLYLPLEHSEDPELQDECVMLFQQLAEITGSQEIADFTRYAVAHRDVIARFGRFPHRNSILGRESTPDELAHLEKHGGF